MSMIKRQESNKSQQNINCIYSGVEGTFHQINGIEPVPYTESDSIEHELKFEICRDWEHNTILDLIFSPYGRIREYRTYSAKDIYLDTADYCLAKHGALCRLREGWKKDKVTVNFKFPAEQCNGVFARREVRSKFKQGPFDVNRVLETSCEASVAAIGFFEENVQTWSGPQDIESRLHVITHRILYVLDNDEWGEFGIISFDASTYHHPASVVKKKEDFELEFEIGLICRRTLDLLDEMSKQLLNFGLSPSQTSKYERGLAHLGVNVEMG